MRTRRILVDLILAAVVSAMAAPGVFAQEPAPPVQVQPAQPPDADSLARSERLEELRADLQRVYEQLFELQVSYQGAAGDQAALDSLAVERAALRARVAEFSARIARENESRERESIRAPQRHGEADFYALLQELSKLERPEDVGQALEGRDIGEVIAIIGEQLKNMEIDVSSDRVRIDTGTGGKISFAVPEELREELSQGMQEIGRELNRAFADSSFGARNWAELIDQLPERMAQGWPDRSAGRRKVIAESAFSMGNDFEVADDEIVQGDVLIIGADAYVAGEVQGAVYVVLGDLIVEERGLIAKDAISLGGRVLVDDRAEILGRRLDFGDVSRFTSPATGHGALAWAFYAGRLVVLVALLLLVYALFNDRMIPMVEHGAARPGRSMMSGALWFTAVFGLFLVASVGLAVSVIGIPVVLVLAVAMALVSMMAYLAGCELVGRRIVALFRPDGPAPAGWTGALIGVALFELPAITVLALGSLGVQSAVTRPLTGLEFVIRFLALSVGFGAVVATRVGRRTAVGRRDGLTPGEAVSAGA